MRAGSTRVLSVHLLGGKLTASKLHFAGVAGLMYHYVLSNPFLGSFVEQNVGHVDRNTVCLPLSLQRKSFEVNTCQLRNDPFLASQH